MDKMNYEIGIDRLEEHVTRIAEQKESMGLIIILNGKTYSTWMGKITEARIDVLLKTAKDIYTRAVKENTQHN